MPSIIMMHVTTDMDKCTGFLLDTCTDTSDTQISIQATDSSNRLPSYMLMSFNSGNSSHVSVFVSTVTVLNLSPFLLKPCVLTLSYKMFSQALLKSMKFPPPRCSFLVKYEGTERRWGTWRDGRGHVPDTSCEFCH